MNERVSEKMLISIILKGLSNRFETFPTIANFKRDEKKLDEAKKDLVIYDSERQVNEKEHAFNMEKRVCLNCPERAKGSKQCTENLGSRQDGEDKAEKSFSAMGVRSLFLLQIFAKQRKN